MPNPEGIATGTSLNRDDAVCRALRELLLLRVRNFDETLYVSNSDLDLQGRLMSLYEELGGVTSDE